MDFVKGQLVRALAGRDKTHTLAVLAIEGEYLFLADGRRRPLARPKRKKAKHTAPTAAILAAQDLQTDRVLRKAIAAYDAAHPI